MKLFYLFLLLSLIGQHENLYTSQNELSVQPPSILKTISSFRKVTIDTDKNETPSTSMDQHSLRPDDHWQSCHEINENKTAIVKTNLTYSKDEDTLKIDQQIHADHLLNKIETIKNLYKKNVSLFQKMRVQTKVIQTLETSKQNLKKQLKMQGEKIQELQNRIDTLENENQLLKELHLESSLKNTPSL